MNVDVEKIVTTAVECSVFLSPTEIGLSTAELVEVGSRLGYEEGEVRDTIQYARKAGTLHQSMGKPYLVLKANPWVCDFLLPAEEPDFRSVPAHDFVLGHLQELVRKLGEQNAQIERSVLVERGVASGLPHDAIEAAIAVMIIGELVSMKGAVLKLAPGRGRHPLASAQIAQAQNEPRRSNELREKVYEVVRDVIERRSDGRSRSPEPLNAFGEALEGLGHKQFRLWWKQMVSELKLLDHSINPVSATVISAALVEGALTFVVKHARRADVGPMKSKDFDGEPRTWKMDDLIRSAASGGAAAILDTGIRQRADELFRTRQRIHAGRMLSEQPGGPPDLRPDEARDARQTAELIVRRVLDWLQMHPLEV